MRQWAGSVAFITGGGQGIGLGIARALAARGVRIALADIDETALHRSGEELAAETIRLDVRDRDGFAAAADRVEARLGPVDLLFNNAGIAPYSAVADLTYDRWDLALGINLTGVINGLQTFLPRMIARGEGGYVVNTASGSGLVTNGNVLYETAKFAVVGLSESLRQAVARHGIEVSVLCPGPVDTGILHHTRSTVGEVAIGVPDVAMKDTAAFLSGGASIDEVGELVIAGMEARSTWIHTGDLIRPYLEERMRRLVDSV